MIEAAKTVLAKNRAGDSTKPSPDLYPHQWMWDSCFIAIGLSRYDPKRAQGELLALLRGQWTNGMVPQIIFNPKATGYFPGPDVWQSERSQLAPKALATSGITQPPVLAMAAMAAFEWDSDRERAEAFGREVYPKIRAFHEFLYRERDPDGSGLVTVVHPWESGLDNSPPYLDAGERVHLTYRPQYTRLDTLHVAAAHRPTAKDYDLFVWLLEQMRTADYDWARYLPAATMQVEDVLFNCILVRANDDLFRLGRALGFADEDEFARYGTRMAIQEKLWDESTGMFYSYDRVAKQLLIDPTVAGLMPLLVWTVGDGAHRRERLLAALADGTRFAASGFACPTTAMNSLRFNPENYWLGPVWVNTNWLVIQALQAQGETAAAERLLANTIELVRRSGFREYFNPFTGEGYGTDQFSWSAALTIDLLTEGER
jgi:hypothetical protein